MIFEMSCVYGLETYLHPLVSGHVASEADCAVRVRMTQASGGRHLRSDGHRWHTSTSSHSKCQERFRGVQLHQGGLVCKGTLLQLLVLQCSLQRWSPPLLRALCHGKGRR